MSDDLVKRLRHIAMFNTPQDPRKGCMEAADRIEKLESQFKLYFHAFNKAADRIEKLEKILRELVCDCAIDCPHFRDPLPSCMCYGAFPKEKKND
jgi:hypothetical protein